MAYSSEGPTLAEQILEARAENLRNVEIAKRVGCSQAYVCRVLKEAGQPSVQPAAPRGPHIPRQRRQRNVFSACRAALRLRNALADYYDATNDDDALDILESLCAVDEGLSRLWEEWA